MASSEESKMTEKESSSVRAFIEESLRSDIDIEIELITKVTVLERLNTKKESEHSRYLAVIGRPGRIVTVKSKLMGKSMECNVVMLTVNALRYFEHRNLFCCEVTWNERASSMVIGSGSVDAMHRILNRLCSVIRRVAQCVLFEPKLVDLPDAVGAVDADKERLSPPAVLSTAYQTLCIVEGVSIDGHLLSLFKDEEFHSENRVFDVDFMLRHYAQSAPAAAKHGVNPLEVFWNLTQCQSP